MPRTQARRGRMLLPRAEHVLLPSCGHVPMGDAPEPAAEIILRGSARAAQTVSERPAG